VGEEDVLAAEDARKRFDLEGQVKECHKWYEEIVCERRAEGQTKNRRNYSGPP